MGKLSRRKGQRWEREVARDMSAASWESGNQYRRNLTEVRDGNTGDVLPVILDETPIPVAAIHRTGRGGEKLAVLRWTDWLEIVSAIPSYAFLLQCKCGARPDIYKAVKEAEDAAT
tara:strand:+ start:267 stop:614 length:348 start_codon:yes stop_codon:yes gene_type:complete